MTPDPRSEMLLNAVVSVETAARSDDGLASIQPYPLQRDQERRDNAVISMAIAKELGLEDDEQTHSRMTLDDWARAIAPDVLSRATGRAAERLLVDDPALLQRAVTGLIFRMKVRQLAQQDQLEASR